jgi:hypothetical protein
MTGVGTLQYGRVSHRKKRWILGWLLGITIFAITALLYYKRASLWLGNSYAEWRYRRTFDRVCETYLGESTLFAPGEGKPNAADAIRSLMMHSRLTTASYVASQPNMILFIERGNSGSDPTLTFASLSHECLQVFTFSRSARMSATWDSYHQVHMTVPSQPAPLIKLLDAQRFETGIRSRFTIDGAENIVDWNTGSPPWTRPGGYSSPVGTYPPNPLTGWTSADNWWPEVGEAKLLTGRKPDRTVPSMSNAFACTFLPDGRLGVASPHEIMLVDPRSVARFTRTPAIPRQGREIGLFSPDGLKCFLGGTDLDAYVVETLTGKVIATMETVGAAQPCFTDDKTLMLLDSVSLRRIDCETGKIEPLDLPRKAVAHMAFGGGLRAYSSVDFGGVRVLGADGKQIQTIPTSAEWMDWISLSPDGSAMILQTIGGLSIVETKTARRLWDHRMDTDMSTSHHVKWSADGSRAAVAGRQFVYVFQLNKPRWVARFPHKLYGYWNDVALSRDGAHLAATATGVNSVSYWESIDDAVSGSGTGDNTR